MANLSPENEARLRAAIADNHLQCVEELIVNSSVECAVFLVSKPDEYAEVGTSRYGGVPDLPDETLWPQSDDGKFYNFYMQINLADVPNFAGNVLPEHGMLYCFMARRNHAAIIWADADASSLKRASEKQESEMTGWDNSTLKPHQLEIRAAINVPGWFSEPYHKIHDAIGEYLDITNGELELYEQLFGEMLYKDAIWQKYGGRSAGRLLGQPEYDYETPNKDRSSLSCDTLLIRLDTNEAVGVEFSDEGYMQIFVNNDALVMQNFLDTVAQMEPPYTHLTEYTQ